MTCAKWMLCVLALVVGCGARAEDMLVDHPSGDNDWLWKAKVAGAIWSSPLYRDNRLYFGSDDGNFYAFDVGTKTVRWKFATGAMIRSSAEIAEDALFFAGDDGFLHALDPETGAEKWRFSLGSADIPRNVPSSEAPYDYDYLASTPVYANGLVYVGSTNGNVYAVAADSGREVWRFATRGRVRATPLLHEGRLYIGSWDGHLYALDARAGKELWRYDTGGIIQGTPAFGDGKVLVGSRSAKLFALDGKAGALAWTFSHADGSWVESPANFHEGVFYVGSSDALKLYALDSRSGREIWSFNTGGWCWGQPVIGGDTVYIGAISAFPYYFEGVELTNGLYAVDKKSGKSKWRLGGEPVAGFITGGVFAPVNLSADGGFAAGVDGYIYAFRNR